MNTYYRDALKLDADREAKLVDLLRNIAGLDLSNLNISKHAVLVEAVKEWRTESGSLLAGLGWSGIGEP